MMRWFNGLLVLGLLVFGASETFSAEPSIDEMLKETESLVRSPSAADPAVSGLAVDEAYVKLMKTRLQYEVDKRAKELMGRGDPIGMGDLCFDLQKWGEAQSYWNEAIQKLPNDWQVQRGYVHQRLCRVYTLLGRKEMAAGALDEALARVSDPHSLERTDRLKQWLGAFPERDKERREFLERLAKEPENPDVRWNLLRTCRDAVPMRLDEFVGLLQFRETNPKDRRVIVSGECDWRLMEIMWHFGMSDEALKIAGKFRDAFPESGVTSNGDACWRLAEWSSSASKLQEALALYEEMKDKYPKHWAVTSGEALWKEGESLRALKRWQEALARFRELKRAYVQHRACSPAPGQDAMVDERMVEAMKNGAR